MLGTAEPAAFRARYAISGRRLDLLLPGGYLAQLFCFPKDEAFTPFLPLPTNTTFVGDSSVHFGGGRGWNGVSWERIHAALLELFPTSAWA